MKSVGIIVERYERHTREELSVNPFKTHYGNVQLVEPWADLGARETLHFWRWLGALIALLVAASLKWRAFETRRTQEEAIMAPVVTGMKEKTSGAVQLTCLAYRAHRHAGISLREPRHA